MAPRPTTTAYINRIATAVPPHDVHDTFIGFARRQLTDERLAALFQRMAAKSGIEHRYSCLAPTEGAAAAGPSGFYRYGDFPGTAERMRMFEAHAPALAAAAID